MSSTGRCFDIGNTVSAALGRFERTGDPFAGSSDQRTAGNGSLMRLAPVQMCYCNDAREAVVRAAQSSKTTHAAYILLGASNLVVGAAIGREIH